MKPANRLRDQFRTAHDRDLAGGRAAFDPKRRHGIGDEQRVQRIGGQVCRGVAGEQAMGGSAENPHRAMLAARFRGTAKRGPAADQVVDDDRDFIADVADQHAAGDHRVASVFFSEGRADRRADRRAQLLPELFSALHAAGVRRDHDHRAVADQRRKVGNEQGCGVEMLGTATKGVLERGQVMDIDGDDGVGAHGFE